MLTGLRGVGKTVLLETFKPLAVREGWLWAGTDLSESATVSEAIIGVRILADLAPLVSGIKVGESEQRRAGFTAAVEKKALHLDFELLKRLYDGTPGLASDKLKTVLEFTWSCLSRTKCRGVVLAYDEAQNLSDQAGDNEYPLSLLLDVFQSVQKKGLPFLLVLAGLPTLFPKLVQARTFSERMFHVATLGRLKEKDCRDAILRPIAERSSSVRFTEQAVKDIVEHSGGYPYFIQFLCRETFDSYLQQKAAGEARPRLTIAQSLHKLDSDFFAGRWHRVTDRQRELLAVVALLPNCDEEFAVQEIVEESRKSLRKPFGASHVNQILAKLADSGLVYKNRHGRYSFAVPLLGGFIQRQQLALLSKGRESPGKTSS